MQRSYISIIESIYLFYMFRHFKTTIDFNMSRTSILNFKIFDHLTTNAKGLRVCYFGQVAILVIIALLLIRHIFIIPYKLTHLILTSAALLSFLNLNALVYLLPVFTIEFLLPTSTHKP